MPAEAPENASTRARRIGDSRSQAVARSPRRAVGSAKRDLRRLCRPDRTPHSLRRRASARPAVVRRRVRHHGPRSDDAGRSGRRRQPRRPARSVGRRGGARRSRRSTGARIGDRADGRRRAVRGVLCGEGPAAIGAIQVGCDRAPDLRRVPTGHRAAAMRIGVDARELCGRPTGAGRYLEHLLAEWAHDDGGRGHQIVLYAPEPVRLKDSRPGTGATYETRIVRGRPGVWWEQIRLPRVARADRLDVFFAPAYTAPHRLDVPLVVAIHDLSFVAHPEWFRRREGVRRRWLTRRAAVRARAIVTESEFSRREIVDRFGIPAGRVHVVSPGTMPAVTHAARHAEPILLFVGSIFNRRHVPDLIRAFARVARAHPEARLEIVGDNRTYPY